MQAENVSGDLIQIIEDLGNYLGVPIFRVNGLREISIGLLVES